MCVGMKRVRTSIGIGVQIAGGSLEITLTVLHIGGYHRRRPMTRSKRKTPIFGHTNRESEKEDKKSWHKAFRRAFKQLFGKEDDLSCLDKGNDEKLYSDPWGMSKDGKHYYRNANEEDMRK